MSRGYELSKKEHILALQSDQDLIKEALRPLANRENSMQISLSNLKMVNEPWLIRNHYKLHPCQWNIMDYLSTFSTYTYTVIYVSALRVDFRHLFG